MHNRVNGKLKQFEGRGSFSGPYCHSLASLADLTIETVQKEKAHSVTGDQKENMKSIAERVTTAAPSKAEERAEAFITANHLKFKITPKGKICPPNDDNCRRGAHKHGLAYYVVLARTNDAPAMIRTASGLVKPRPKFGTEFYFWLRDGIEYPSTAVLLHYIAEAVTWPTTPDEVFDSTGGALRPSECILRASLSERLTKFLTEEEIKMVRGY